MNNWVLLQEWKKKQMNRPGSPRPNHTHGIIGRRSDALDQWEVGGVCHRRGRDSNLLSWLGGRRNWNPYLTAHAKINSEWLKHVNERQSYDILEYREKSLRPQHRRISFKNAEKM